MKKAYLFHVALLLVGVLFVPTSRAEDYTRRNLPEAALARLGKGRRKRRSIQPMARGWR